MPVVRLADVRLLLHDAVCRSEVCTERPKSRAEHAQTQQDAARKVVAATTPAERAGVVHDRVCPAQVDSATFLGGCPERDRHVAWIARHPVMRPLTPTG